MWSHRVPRKRYYGFRSQLRGSPCGFQPEVISSQSSVISHQ
jgi:hypothetical protein